MTSYVSPSFAMTPTRFHPSPRLVMTSYASLPFVPTRHRSPNFLRVSMRCPDLPSLPMISYASTSTCHPSSSSATYKCLKWFKSLQRLLIYLFIYHSYSLEPVGYGRYRKEISINKSSKTDMRKQARRPDKGNPPPGRRLPQSIRAPLYQN